MSLHLSPLSSVDPSIFIAPNATVFGNVRIGNQATIWFGAVVRGDTESIEIGEQTNIQDLCVLHSDPGFPCHVGSRVTVGHAAIIHGATIQDDVLIGMRSVILNGAVIGTGSVIASGAVVTEGAIIPPHSLVMGMPGKVRGATTPQHAEMIRRGTTHYVEAGKQYLASPHFQTP